MYRVFSAHPHSSSHLLSTSIRHLDEVAPSARIAILASLNAFDEFAKRMGWGGSIPAWRSWAGHAWEAITPPHLRPR